MSPLEEEERIAPPLARKPSLLEQRAASVRRQMSRLSQHGLSRPSSGAGGAPGGAESYTSTKKDSVVSDRL